MAFHAPALPWTGPIFCPDHRGQSPQPHRSGTRDSRRPMHYTPEERSDNRLAFACVPDLIGHIASGNLPCPTMMSMIQGLLVGSAQFIKCAENAGWLPALFAHSLRYPPCSGPASNWPTGRAANQNSNHRYLMRLIASQPPDAMKPLPLFGHVWIRDGALLDTATASALLIFRKTCSRALSRDLAAHGAGYCS